MVVVVSMFFRTFPYRICILWSQLFSLLLVDFSTACSPYMTDKPCRNIPFATVAISLCCHPQRMSESEFVRQHLWVFEPEATVATCDVLRFICPLSSPPLWLLNIVEFMYTLSVDVFQERERRCVMPWWMREEPCSLCAPCLGILTSLFADSKKMSFASSKLDMNTHTTLLLLGFWKVFSHASTCTWTSFCMSSDSASTVFVPVRLRAHNAVLSNFVLSWFAVVSPWLFQWSAKRFRCLAACRCTMDSCSGLKIWTPLLTFYNGRYRSALEMVTTLYWSSTELELDLKLLIHVTGTWNGAYHPCSGA